jgi:polyisoprenoid-binding protein YceI
VFSVFFWRFNGYFGDYICKTPGFENLFSLESEDVTYHCLLSFLAMKKHFIIPLAASFILSGCTDHMKFSRYELDATRSLATWRGYLRTGYFNEGSIAIESSGISVADGKITGGAFTMPLSSISNFNLPTAELKRELVHHLQSAVFFNMVLHPTLKFEITGITTYSGFGDDVIDGANYQVSGMLTMLGKAKLIGFPAKVIFNGEIVTLEAKTGVDRTQWGMVYGTDETQPAEAIIEPVIDIHLKLEGRMK